MRNLNLTETFRELEERYRKSTHALLTKMAIVLMALHLIDMIESYLLGYAYSLYWEIGRIVVVLIVMIPNRIWGIGEKMLDHHLIYLPLIFFYGTLWIPDENYFLTLPWLLFIGVLPFWIFTNKIALRWAVVQSTLLGLVTLLSALGAVHTLYNTSLLFQVWGVLSVTIYIVYNIEEKRELYKQQIQALATENRLLYDEMMHRTKNNLQLIIGLIEQEQTLLDPGVETTSLRKLAYRVRAFDAILASRIQDDEGKIDLSAMIQHIVEMYRPDMNCEFELRLESVVMQHKYANYLALIVNEAINNVQKHACPHGADKVLIVLEKQSNGLLHLVIQDNGKRQPRTPKEKPQGGTLLMKRLVDTLPEGLFSEVYDGGMRIEVTCQMGRKEGQTKTE